MLKETHTNNTNKQQQITHFDQPYVGQISNQQFYTKIVCTSPENNEQKKQSLFILSKKIHCIQVATVYPFFLT